MTNKTCYNCINNDDQFEGECEDCYNELEQGPENWARIMRPTSIKNIAIILWQMLVILLDVYLLEKGLDQYPKNLVHLRGNPALKDWIKSERIRRKQLQDKFENIVLW